MLFTEHNDFFVPTNKTTHPFISIFNLQEITEEARNTVFIYTVYCDNTRAKEDSRSMNDNKSKPQRTRYLEILFLFTNLYWNILLKPRANVCNALHRIKALLTEEEMERARGKSTVLMIQPDV